LKLFFSRLHPGVRFYFFVPIFGSDQPAPPFKMFVMLQPVWHVVLDKGCPSEPPKNPALMRVGLGFHH
jgi:hypothetical protein